MAGTVRGDADEVRLFTVPFVLLGVADLAYFTSVGVAIHTLPLYVTGPIDSDKAGAGLAFGAFGVTALLCRPYAGRLSDTLGRRPLLIVGALLAAFGMVLLPYVDSLALVVAIRLLQGVAEAAFFVAGFAMLADLAPPSRMGEALSYNSLGLYLGIALGPPFAELLIENFDYTAAWYGATALSVAAALLVLTIAEPERDHSEAGHGKLIHRPGIPISLGFFASLAAVSGFLAFASLHSEEVGLEQHQPGAVHLRLRGRAVPDRLRPRAGPAPVAAAWQPPPWSRSASASSVIALWQQPVGTDDRRGGHGRRCHVLHAGVLLRDLRHREALRARRRGRHRERVHRPRPRLRPDPARPGRGRAGIPSAFGVGAAVAFAGAIWTLSLARPAVSGSSSGSAWPWPASTRRRDRSSGR